jgi:protein O-mannosyl-transferase
LTSAAKTRAPAHGETVPWAHIVVLVGITVTLYSPISHHEFVGYDDGGYVVRNVRVLAGLSWENVRWAFTEPSVGGHWHPLTVLSHMLDCTLYGSVPVGHKVTNIILHGLNTFLVFWVLRAMTGSRWRSAFVAALFGWHPVNVESVAWIAERKNLLSTLFGLLAILAYVRYVRRPKVWRYAMICVLFVLSLLAKAMLVTLPFVLMLLDYWPLGRYEPDNRFVARFVRLFREKSPLLLLSLVGGILAVHSQSVGGSMGDVSRLPLATRTANAVVSYAKYILKMFWPTNLSVLYPHPGMTLPEWQIVLSGLFLVGVTFYVVWKGRALPFMAVGWFWFVGTLVPVIGLVQQGEQAMANRYAYVPLIGLFILTVWGVHRAATSFRVPKSFTLAVGCVVLAVLTVVTHVQLDHWRNTLELWRYAVESTDGNNPIAVFQLNASLAGSLIAQGKVAEGIEAFGEAVKADPATSGDPGVRRTEIAAANLGIGMLLGQRGRVVEATRFFSDAVRWDPACFEAYSYLGVALDSQGRTDEALRAYYRAVEINPQYARGQFNLGTALMSRGRTGEAIACLAKAVELDAGYAEAHNQLGVALNIVGEREEAIGHFLHVIRLHPGDRDAHNNLGVVLMAEERVGEAVAQFQAALETDPNTPNARQNLERALAEKKRLEDAVVGYDGDLRARPESWVIHHELGAALMSLGRLDPALDHLQKAVALNAASASAWADLGRCFLLMGRTDDALAALRHALESSSDRAQVAAIQQRIGRILATKMTVR